MAGSDTAAMVPGRYDVVIDGYGYMLDRRPEGAAELGYTATFLPRQNVSGRYGDNEQDFFFTASQNDWSSGEGQNFLRVNDDDSRSRYLRGSNIGIDTPSQLTLRNAATSISIASPVAACLGTTGGIILVTASDFYRVTGTGAFSAAVSHGAGTASRWCATSDGTYTYISGATKIRRATSLDAVSDFSATAAAGSLAFLNNALYSCDGSTLRTYDTAGTATTLYLWKNADGTAFVPTTAPAKLVPFGSQLLIFFPTGVTSGPELWLYDGSGTSKIMDLSPAVLGHDCIVHEGVVYMSGAVQGVKRDGFTAGRTNAIYYYLNGTVGELWRSENTGVNSCVPAVGNATGKVVWSDGSTREVFQYNPLTGAISRLFTYGGTTTTFNNSVLASNGQQIVVGANGDTTQTFFPSSSALATTGSVTMSAIDFDNSLSKAFRGVTVDWTGSGSVDIAYAVDDDAVAPTFTTLQTTAVAGTEYTFGSSITGRRITLKITLNPSGTNSPILRRVYVRAAPRLQSYRRAVYAIDCSGRNGVQPVIRRDGTPHELDGSAMLTNLRATLASTTPVSITDSLGTFTGVIEPDGFQALQVGAEEYVATVTARGV